MRGSGLQGAVQTTMLVHDSHVKLATIAIGDRLQFFAYSSRGDCDWSAPELPRLRTQAEP